MTGNATEDLLGPVLPIVCWWVDEFDTDGTYNPTLKRTVYTTIPRVLAFIEHGMKMPPTAMSFDFIQRLIDPNGDPSWSQQNWRHFTLGGQEDVEVFVEGCAWFQVASLGFGSPSHEPADCLLSDLSQVDPLDPADPDRRWR